MNKEREEDSLRSSWGLYISYAESPSIPTRHNQPSLFLSSCSLFVHVPNLCVHRASGTRRYIFHTQSHLPSLRDTISPLSSCRVALCSCPSRTSARIEIGRAGLRNPTPCIETPAQVCGQSGFWGASSATARRDRLLPLRRIEIIFVFFLVAPSGRLRLLSGGRSRNCTANIFLHRLWSATSRNTLCQLV